MASPEVSVNSDGSAPASHAAALKAQLGKARSAAIYYSKKVYMVTKENPVVIVTVLFLLILIIAVFSAFTSFLQAFLSGTGVAVVYLALFVLLVKLVIRALVFPGSCMLWQQKLEGAYRTDLAKAYYDAVVQLEQLLLVLSGRPAWQKWSPSQAVFGYNILQQIQRNFELLRKEQIPEFVATASTTTSTSRTAPRSLHLTASRRSSTSSRYVSLPTTGNSTPQSFTSEQLELEKRIASVMNTFASLRVEKRDGSCPDTFLRYLFKDVAAAESAYGGGRNVMDEISRTRLTTKDAAVLELKEIAALLKALHEPAETYRGAVKRFFAKATVGSLDSVRGELMQRKPACQMWIPVVSSSSSAAGAPDGGDHDVGTEVVEQSTPTTIGVVDAAFVFSKTHIQKIKAAGSQIAQLLHEAKRKEEQERSHGGGRARAEGVPAQHAEMIGSATTSHMPPGGRGGGGAGAEKTLFETVTADMLEGIDLENNPLQDPVDGSPWNFPAEKLQVLLKLAGNPCVVVFCNPNAGYYESQAFQSDWVDFYHSLGHAVLLFNYRGFGRSGALSSGPAAAASGGQSVVGRCGGGGCADFTSTWDSYNCCKPTNVPASTAAARRSLRVLVAGGRRGKRLLYNAGAGLRGVVNRCRGGGNHAGQSATSSSSEMNYPSPQSIKQDGLSVYDFLARSVGASRIAVHGRSIGSVCACEVACRKSLENASSPNSTSPKPEFCVIDRGFASLQRTAELGYGSWAKVGLKSSAYDVCNVQNYLQISCRKILIVDPHDEVIPDLASLRSSVAFDSLLPVQRARAGTSASTRKSSWDTSGSTAAIGLRSCSSRSNSTNTSEDENGFDNSRTELVLSASESTACTSALNDDAASTCTTASRMSRAELLQHQNLQVGGSSSSASSASSEPHHGGNVNYAADGRNLSADDGTRTPSIPATNSTSVRRRQVVERGDLNLFSFDASNRAELLKQARSFAKRSARFLDRSSSSFSTIEHPLEKLILSDNRFEQKECEKQLLKVIENYQWLQKLMVLIYTADEEVNYNPPTGAQCQWGPPTGRSSSSRRGPRGAKNRYEPMGTVWSDEQRLFHEMLHGDVGLKWLDEHKRFVRHLFAESPIMFYLRDAFETLCGGLNAGGSTVDDVLSRTEFGAFVDYAHGLRQFLSNLAVWGSMPAASSGGSFVSDLTAARSSDLPAEVTAVERYVYQRRKRAPTRFVNYGGRVMQVADGSREPNNLTSENPPDASAIGDYHRVLAHLLLQQSRAKFRRVVQDVMLLSTEELLSSCPASFGGQEHGKVGSSSSGSSCSSQTRTSTANHTTHTTHVNSSQTAAAANQPHTIGATATASCSPRNTSADTQTDELKYFVVNKLLGLEQLFTLAARCLHRYSTPLLVHASEFREGGGGEVPAASNAAGTRNCCSVAELLVLSDRCMDAIGQGGSTNPSAAAAAAQREAERAIEHGKAIALAEERAAAGGAKPENKNGFLASARSFLFEDDEMPSTAATKSKSKNFLEIEMSDFTTPKSSNASNKRGGTSPSSSTPGVGADVGVDVGGSTNSSAATFEAAAQRMSRGEAERVRAERMTKTGYILHVDCGHNGALSSGDLKHLALYLEGGSAG
mmetsp:Transcript_21482/g.54058  ORF Transcript_21482/g.54058 Transcript_21482/m.54058 type:complete len:1606 (+) Transcript_21482:84-4901(+)